MTNKTLGKLQLLLIVITTLFGFLSWYLDGRSFKIRGWLTNICIDFFGKCSSPLYSFINSIEQIAGFLSIISLIIFLVLLFMGAFRLRRNSSAIWYVVLIFIALLFISVGIGFMYAPCPQYSTSLPGSVVHNDVNCLLNSKVVGVVAVTSALSILGIIITSILVAFKLIKT